MGGEVFFFGMYEREKKGRRKMKLDFTNPIIFIFLGFCYLILGFRIFSISFYYF